MTTDAIPDAPETTPKAIPKAIPEATPKAQEQARARSRPPAPSHHERVSAPFGLGEISTMLAQVAAAASSPSIDDATRIDVIAALERVKGATAAAQARVEIAFRDSQVAQQRQRGVARADLGKGVADQVALARGLSPKTGSDQLALRRVLIETLPETTDLLASGQISEWAAHEVAKAVPVLDDEDRAAIDHELAGQLPTLTAPRAGRAARKRAQELDPAAAVKRAAKAVADRRVTIRPAPEAMVNVTALLPAHEGVATYAALNQHAKTLRAAGDGRGVSQVMADTLVERITGAADAGHIPLEVQLLMTDTTLLADGNEGASIDGHPIPGAIARHLALGALPGTTRPRERDPGTRTHAHDPGAGLTESSARDPGAAETASSPEVTEHELARVRRWIRRLYTDPVTGELTAMDSRRRLFTGAMRRFIALRDQDCRTPWCDAPIRHLDHVHRHANGGTTTTGNGVGVCERFNHVKELPGWHTHATPAAADADADGGADGGAGADGGGSPVLRITTPTGHTYTSSPPPLRTHRQAAPPPAPAPAPETRPPSTSADTTPADPATPARAKPATAPRFVPDSASRSAPATHRPVPSVPTRSVPDPGSRSAPAASTADCGSRSAPTPTSRSTPAAATRSGPTATIRATAPEPARPGRAVPQRPPRHTVPRHTVPPLRVIHTDLDDLPATISRLEADHTRHLPTHHRE